ncbi:MAG: NifB/NifX family molybdenum-iron cluster-binding protein [Deltaproteobacteria bacterium]|nr:NifB/NifX family molybdenum-iron cluster-binding protein [Deltaproteobacteria bacterium]
MKICVTSAGQSLEDIIDPRFGRCQYFIILDTESMQFEAIQNPAISAGGGAGIKAAQLVANKEVEVVLTGNVGPNAFNTLQAAGLKIVVGLSNLTVKQAVEGFKSGQYQHVGSPSVDAHYGTSGGGGNPTGGMGAGGGRGGGTGAGGGRGMGRGMGMVPQQPPPQLSKDEELKILGEQSQKMKKDLEGIDGRIDELLKKKK